MQEEEVGGLVALPRICVETSGKLSLYSGSKAGVFLEMMKCVTEKAKRCLLALLR